MKLNKTSYLPVKVRVLCQKLECSTGMKLITNLSEEFEDVRFKGKISYVIIAFKEQAIYTLSHSLTKDEMAMIEDIIIYLRFMIPFKK